MESLLYNARRIGMRKIIGIFFVTVIVGFVAPGAFATTISHHHQRQHSHQHHHQHHKHHA